MHSGGECGGDQATWELLEHTGLFVFVRAENRRYAELTCE